MAPIKGNSKKQQVKSKTPDIQKQKQQQGKKKTPKSAPQMKRKKLEVEIDEELSDLDFDEVLLGVKGSEKNGNSSVIKDEADVEDDSSVDDEEMETNENVKYMINDSDDDSDEEEDDDEESDEEDSDVDDEDDEDDEDEEEEEEEEEDDDDDDDDDDESIEENSESKTKGPPKERKNLLDLFEGSDSEQSDEDEDNGPIEKVIKKKIKDKAKKRKAEDSHADAPQAKKKGLSEIDAKEVEKARMERDSRSLFVKNLPTDVKVPQIQALSNDIINIRLRLSNKRNSKNKGYAFVEFKNEQLAEKNFSILNSKKVGDCQLVVDYVGAKSTKANQKPALVSASDLDPFKLYVNGFGQDSKENDLKKIFPTATKIDLPSKNKTKLLLGFAFVHYTDPEICKKGLAAANNKVVGGNKITVSYAKKAVAVQKTKPVKRKGKDKTQGKPKKSTTKPIVVQEDGDDDSEDDDNDDDDDDEVSDDAVNEVDESDDDDDSSD